MSALGGAFIRQVRRKGVVWLCYLCEAFRADLQTAGRKSNVLLLTGRLQTVIALVH